MATIGLFLEWRDTLCSISVGHEHVCICVLCGHLGFFRAPNVHSQIDFQFYSTWLHSIQFYIYTMLHLSLAIIFHYIPSTPFQNQKSNSRVELQNLGNTTHQSGEHNGSRIALMNQMVLSFQKWSRRRLHIILLGSWPTKQARLSTARPLSTQVEVMLVCYRQCLIALLIELVVRENYCCPRKLTLPPSFFLPWPKPPRGEGGASESGVHYTAGRLHYT